MRTTLTLDDELARELKKRARLTDKSFKSVVNETLRKGLSVGAKPEPDLPPFEVRTISSPFQPGVDVYSLNRLIDDVEVEDFQREMADAAASERDRER